MQCSALWLAACRTLPSSGCMQLRASTRARPILHEDDRRICIKRCWRGSQSLHNWCCCADVPNWWFPRHQLLLCALAALVLLWLRCACPLSMVPRERERRAVVGAAATAHYSAVSATNDGRTTARGATCVPPISQQGWGLPSTLRQMALLAPNHLIPQSCMRIS